MRRSGLAILLGLMGFGFAIQSGLPGPVQSATVTPTGQTIWLHTDSGPSFLRALTQMPFFYYVHSVEFGVALGIIGWILPWIWRHRPVGTRNQKN
jgi:hypothetical protein